MSKKSRKQNAEVAAEVVSQESSVAVAEPVAEVAAVTPAAEPKKHIVISEQGLANRAAASQRTAQGKWNKVAFAKVGGSECPKFAPMTWVQRDKFMAGDSEAALAVRTRYEQHMAEVEAAKAV